MGTFLMGIFGWLLLQFRKESSERDKVKNNGFFDMLATSAPKKSPRDLFEIIHSAQFEEMDIGENAMLLNEMVISMIRPGMGTEEVKNVKSSFFAPILAIIALQSTGGVNGEVKDAKFD